MHILLETLETSLSEMRIFRGKVSELQAKNCVEAYALVKDLIDEGLFDEALALLKEILEEYNDLVMVYYYLALFAYMTGDNGDQHLAVFFVSLQRYGKTNLIEVIAEQVLKHYQSTYVYTTLAQQAERSGDREKLIFLLKQLLEQNPDDIVMAKKLAKQYAEDDIELAHRYYEQAMVSSFDASDFGETVSIWNTLVQLCPEKVDFLITWAKKLTQHVGTEHAYDLFSSLLKAQERTSEGSQHAIIKIIKAALEMEIVLHSQFFLILRAYRDLYENHNYLNDFLTLSGLPKLIKSKKGNKAPELFLTYINRFEKVIRLDQGTFVHHKSFGFGMIDRLKKGADIPGIQVVIPKLICDFEKKRRHEMSLDIALKSLNLCYERHVVALKLFQKEEFEKLLAMPTILFAKEVLRTLDHPTTSKEIHDLLVPRVFNETQWSSRWRELKKAFTDDHEVDFNGKTYSLVTDGMDPDERTLAAFKHTTKADEKLRIIDNYLVHQKKTTKRVLEAFSEALAVLAEEEKDLALLCAVLSQQISQRHHQIKEGALSFSAVYHAAGAGKKNDGVGARRSFLASFNFALSQQQRHALLHELTSVLSGAALAQELSEMFSDANAKHRELLFEELRKRDVAGIFNKTCRRVSDHYLQECEAFVIVGLALLGEASKEVFEERESILYKMVKLLTELQRLIAIDKDVFLSKRLYTTLTRLFFEQDILITYLEQGDTSRPLKEGEVSYYERIFEELNQQAFHPEPLKIRLRAIREKIRQRGDVGAKA